MDRNKRAVFRHLDASHGRLSHRITHLERRTREHLSGLSTAMKEGFAAERTECQDRADRRAIRDRINQERHQVRFRLALVFLGGPQGANFSKLALLYTGVISL